MKSSIAIGAGAGYLVGTCAGAVGDTVYLDYETGKANFLDWIQNDLK